MNQDEIGVDCGGVCDLMCDSQITPLNMVWVRSFKVGEGLWNAFAYIENPNLQSEVTEARYKFKLFDRSNTLIAEREGSTFITQDTLLPVFLGRVKTGDATVYRTTFEWTEPLVWRRAPEVYEIALEQQAVINTDTQPEIHATLVNKEPFPLRNIEIAAIVYDAYDNAIGVSRTTVESVSARGRSNITFAWSSPFEVQPKRWQLVPRVPEQEE